MSTNLFSTIHENPTQPALPFVRPSLPKFEDLSAPYSEILHSGIVTTGHHAERLGDVLANYLQVKYAIAVSSCTSGLLLATRALNLPEGSEVILPSFTFMASALSPVWNKLTLRFVDVDLKTMNIDVELVRQAITPNTSAIIGVHQFGTPVNVEALETLAKNHNISLYFDTAHGFGSLHYGKPLGGNGRFEVFSMSPTKLLIAGEGGIVATDDDAIGEAVYYGRNYANPGNYDCLFPGLNARMSEFHAILALNSFDMLEEAAIHRNWAVNLYKQQLGEIPGISFQHVESYDRSSYKDFTIVIDENEFGLTRDELIDALKIHNIQTRVYYKPVLHQMTAFRHFAEGISPDQFANSIYLSEHALSLPLYSDMTESEVSYACETLMKIHQNASGYAN